MGKLLQMTLLFESSEPEPVLSVAGQAAPVPASEPQEPLPEEEPAWPPDETPDAAERASALDIHRSWIVEAPAGSGKTGLLIQRYLRLLASGDLEAPREVLALTFTRKADAEMRHRVLEQLRAAAAGDSLPQGAHPFAVSTRRLAQAVLARDRALGWGILENPRQLNIRTIDSLCAELAGGQPLLAGAGGRYAPTEDPQPLYDTAAERTLLRMGGGNAGLTRDLQDLLLLRDAWPDDFVRLLAGMLREREQWGELVPLSSAQLTDEALDAEVRPRLTRTLERLIGAELRRAASLLGADLLRNSVHLAHELSSCPGYRQAANPFDAFAQHASAPGTTASDLPQWLCLIQLLLTRDEKGKWRNGFKNNQLGIEVTDEQRLQWQYLIGEARQRSQYHPELPEVLSRLRLLPPASYPDPQWHYVKALCRVLREALLELQIVFAERRSCDFTEVSLTARQLLRPGSAASDLLDTTLGGLRHLLVDEMQDTSAGQYELLEQLTSSWDGSTQTLFLVGDPKQSIYEFRQARVERFLRVMNEGRFGGIAVGAVHLTANFRSQAALVDAFNTTFAAILPRPEDLARDGEATAVPFVLATATRSAGHSPAVQWHAEQQQKAAVTRADDASGSSPASPEAQAGALRAVLEDFRDRWQSQPDGVARKPPRIAVLARTRSHFAPVVQEFHRDRGRGPVPFRAVDIEALDERPEVLDLVSLTRALLHPADRVAWLAVLRSPLCGLGLGDLLALTGEGEDADRNAPVAQLLERHRDHLSPSGQQLLQRCWPVLRSALDDVGRTPLHTHVERTWLSLGGDAPLHPHERSNARRFLELLTQLEAGAEPLSLALLTRRLKGLYAAPAAHEWAVDLMTIHKAKGLEWDLVLIPAMDRGSGRDQHEFLRWLEFDAANGDAGFLLAPIHGKGDPSSCLSRWLGFYQTARELAEVKRLFYVACTRAREELHLFAAVSRKQDGTLETPLPSSLLRAAWPVAGPLLEQQLGRTPALAEVLTFPPQNTADTFALAAAGSGPAAGDLVKTATPASYPPPPVRRLPAEFDLEAPFRSGSGPGLPYPSADSLRHGAAFARPEGSFAARAFGNVVHRFLPVLADQLAAGVKPGALLRALPGWLPRLVTALRAEGLTPTQAGSEALRALAALETTLGDPAGLWLLSPHPQARNEASLDSLPPAGGATLRADRTFFAASSPETSTAPEDVLWIVDYKTAELGRRPREAFLLEQKAKYLPQMEAYARRAALAGHDGTRICLALYFPLLPALLHWRQAD